jgi:hypothetical protein
VIFPELKILIKKLLSAIKATFVASGENLGS